MNERELIHVLLKGELTIRGQFVAGSNYTFLGRVTVDAGAEGGIEVVYKPVRGEQPLWDFPEGSLARRETAAYLVSRYLGWNLTPTTVYRGEGPQGAGSVQVFVEHDPNLHYFNLSEEDRERLRPAALFDVVINNADRKGGHILRGADGHLWLIDHGLCFHAEDKLRTVVWDFAGQAIPAELALDMERLAADLERNGPLARKLARLISARERVCMAARARNLLAEGVFPTPSETRRSYPWPPV